MPFRLAFTPRDLNIRIVVATRRVKQIRGDLTRRTPTVSGRVLERLTAGKTPPGSSRRLKPRHIFRAPSASPRPIARPAHAGRIAGLSRVLLPRRDSLNRLEDFRIATAIMNAIEF